MAKYLFYKSPVSVLELCFMRGVILFVGGIFEQLWLHQQLYCYLKEEKLILFLLSSFFETIYMCLEMAALYFIPLSIFVVLMGTTSNLAGIMNFLINGQVMTKMNSIGILFSVIGILWLLQPELLYKERNYGTINFQNKNDPKNISKVEIIS